MTATRYDTEEERLTAERDYYRRRYLDAAARYSRAAAELSAVRRELARLRAQLRRRRKPEGRPRT